MTPIFLAHESRQDLISIINKQLQLLDEWFRVNRLSLNVDKSNFIVFHTSRETIPQMQNKINMKEVNIKQVVTSKFLGLIQDEHLTWTPHIKVTAVEIDKHIWYVKRNCISIAKVNISGFILYNDKHTFVTQGPKALRLSGIIHGNTSKNSREGCSS